MWGCDNDAMKQRQEGQHVSTWLDDYQKAHRQFVTAQLTVREAVRARGRAIVRARREGLTQAEIAEATGMSKQRVQQLAPGRIDKETTE